MIFGTKLASLFCDVNLFDDVCNLMVKKKITVDNYRDYDIYYDELTGLAIAYHESYSKYLGNTYQRIFASLFQNPETNLVILNQIAKHEHTTVSEIKKLNPKLKFRKGSTILIKEMILAVIETKLNVN